MPDLRSAVGPICALTALALQLVAQQPATNQDASLLRLRYATFDPAVEQPELHPALAARSGESLWIVQSQGLPTDAFRDAIQTFGGEVHGYLPHNAYVVRMSADASREVAAHRTSRAVIPYHPAFRLEEFLLDHIAKGQPLGSQRYNLVVVDKHKDKPALAGAIAGFGGKVLDLQVGSLLMTVELDDRQLIATAHLDQVLWLDRWSAPELDMDNARAQGGGNYVESAAGYTGNGVRGHVYEGVEASHPDFNTPMTNVASSGGADSHGHCTAGIVFGNGSSAPQARGMAPDAVGFYTQYSSPTVSRNAVIGQVVNTHQAMFTTASWGGARTRSYTSVSADADDIIFDHRIPWTQSQSNAGNQDSRPQAWAKNIFSIGGVYHFNNSNAADDSWNGGGSTGPASDGRIKPDLCAYYDQIWCSDRTGASGYSSGSSTTGFGGTSGATPICAGHNAIAIQMYTDGIFNNPLPVPGGTRFQNRPLAQTLKALQIANARQYSFTSGSANNRREHCGWGFPNLQDMFVNRGRTYIVPENDPLTQGAGRTHNITVLTGTSELKVCMTFLDPSANPASTLAAINDLTLKVTSPSGTVFWGNNGLSTGNFSTPGGTANTIDTVENVFVQNPQPGTWQVDVIATLVAQDAHVATGQVDATYALCVVGGTGSGGGTGQFASAAPFGTGCGAPSTASVGQTFYEQFGSFDLGNSALRFTPQAGGQWSVSTCNGCFLSTYSNNLGLGDDVLSRNNALGFAFPLPGGGTTNSIDVDSNGWIGLVANAHGASDYTESVTEFLGNPQRIAACWDDLNPSNGGGVYFDTAPGMAYITWAGVPEFSNTGSNTFQIQLMASGEFVLAYESMTVADCLVGHSLGNGTADPGPSDLSNPVSITTLSHGVNAPPTFGSQITMTTRDFPAGSTAGVHVMALSGLNPGIDLTPQGMPGCFQYTPPTNVQIVFASGTTMNSSLTVPNDPSFMALPIFSQGYAFSVGSNAAGVLSSNAISMLVGN